MAYAARTKDDPLDLGRAADQNESVDNDAFLYALKKYAQMVIIEWVTDCEVSDGVFYLHIPAEIDGMNLRECHARVITAGTTGTMDIQIHNLTDSVDMLTTKITVDTGETGSDTAAAPYVIDAGNDDVAENDVIRVDIDAIHTTPAKGLIVTLGFGEA